MSTVKERIIGAVSIMPEKEAEKLWTLIQETFALNNAEEVEADEDEIKALNAFHNGDPDYQPVYSQEDVLQKLGL